MKIVIITGEESGDNLGAHLMDALSNRRAGLKFAGVGSQRLATRGMSLFFPMSDIAVMGVGSIVRHLPKLIRRGYQAVDATLAEDPDLLILIDSPGFTHSVAKRVARKRPDLPIVDYVAPTVWAWKSWRARQMRAYVDHVLAVLPFEPEVFKELHGPACTYVGHPLIERLEQFEPQAGERPDIAVSPTLVVLPGSRKTEINRLMEPFGETVEIVSRRLNGMKVLLPAVAHLEDEIRTRAQNWAVEPEIVTGEEAKFRAFRQSHAALAASGTVTLELALAQVPMVVAYRVDIILRTFKPLLDIQSIVLANLMIGENIVPEFIDDDGRPDVLADSLLPLLTDSPERAAQLDGLARASGAMRLPNDERPSERAAEVVLQVLESGPVRS